MEIGNRINPKPFSFGAYLVTDDSLCIHYSIDKVIEFSLSAGIKLIQIREKSLKTDEFTKKAERLLALVHSYGAYLIINDRVDIAKSIGADGVHLGQSDMPVKEARALLGNQVWIGLSVENDSHLESAIHLPCDSIALSPLFPTQTKLDASSPWGLDGLERARARTNKHITVIGGVNASNSFEIAKLGADSLAVVSAICSAKDPEIIAREIQREFQKGKNDYLKNAGLS